MSDHQDRSFARRKIRDWALILPLLGLIFLAPPIASMVPADSEIAGLPATVVYIFAVWAGLILGAFALARWIGMQGGEVELDTAIVDQDEEPGP